MHLPKGRRGWIKLVLILIAAFAAYQLVKRLLPDIDPQDLLDQASNSLGKWTYAIVALLAFLETGAFVGLVAPGETFVVLAGAVAGQGETSLILTIGIVWLSAFLGDTASYFLGDRLGRDFIIRHGDKLRITKERFAQVESYFDKHGGKTILIGRFIGLVRALAPFIAGSSGMRYRAMAPYSILGTGLWATAFTLLGYFASKNIEAVLNNSERALLAFALIVGLIVGGVLLVRWIKVEENRARAAVWMEERPVFRNLLATGRRLTPQARFLWERLTPGGLGLELTSALAALSVGTYIVIAYAVLTGDNPGPTPGDQTAADVANSLQADWLTDIAKVVTALGSSFAIVVVTVATAAWLAHGGHRTEIVVLIVGVILILIAPTVIKDVVDRPRPDGGLVDAPGFAYPSGHAAHSVVYAWIALTIALRLRPGMSRASALVAGGLLLAAAIGLSRVYLGVHYMSDVSGGWALGVSIFALIAVIAVLVGHFRQNGRMEESVGP
jgi:membrane protein DedA with SNARE-associated domain/membrane-associated phospholipid phosphatase